MLVGKGLFDHGKVFVFYAMCLLLLYLLKGVVRSFTLLVPVLCCLDSECARLYVQMCMFVYL